ncbi:hypothetical protein P389DRAFT_198111 [Cystobasidium minutum MCA 4210]|uniref:uncharacterized protein n=1 Tax=Cystobasidium minutum MCA 4210 TaxID=1397322 RepID=UPI0034CD44DC|eukprot:jgi/Rhomi1/198111/gm1.6325_g
MSSRSNRDGPSLKHPEEPRDSRRDSASHRNRQHYGRLPEDPKQPKKSGFFKRANKAVDERLGETVYESVLLGKLAWHGVAGAIDDLADKAVDTFESFFSSSTPAAPERKANFTSNAPRQTSPNRHAPRKDDGDREERQDHETDHVARGRGSDRYLGAQGSGKGKGRYGERSRAYREEEGHRSRSRVDVQRPRTPSTNRASGDGYYAAEAVSSHC